MPFLTSGKLSLAVEDEVTTIRLTLNRERFTILAFFAEKQNQFTEHRISNDSYLQYEFLSNIIQSQFKLVELGFRSNL